MKIDLQEFIAQREKLAQYCGEAATALESLDTAVVIGGVPVSGPLLLADLISKLRSKVFRVLVAGEFNAGKSFFLNTLLDRWSTSPDTGTGKPKVSGLLGVDIVPATAIVTELRHSKFDSAELSLRNGGMVPLDLHDLASFTDLARFGRDSTAHLNAAGVFQSLADELGVPLEQLGTVSSGRSETVSRWLYDTFDRAVVYLRSELLEDGVVLVDSPGLGAVYEEHERITESEMRRSDAVLFLMDSASPLTGRAMNFLLSARGFVDNFFFVQTKIDRFSENSIDVERTRQFNISRIAEVMGCNASETRYHSVSARLYRDGRAAASDSICEKSHMAELVTDLSQFLVSSRGPRTLNHELDVLSKLVKQGVAACEERLSMAQATAEELDRRLAEARCVAESLARLQFEVHSLITTTSGDMQRTLLVRQPSLRDTMQGAKDKMARWREIIGSSDRALSFTLRRLASDFVYKTLYPDVDAETTHLQSCVNVKLAALNLSFMFVRINTTVLEPSVSSSWWERLFGGTDYEAQIDEYCSQLIVNLGKVIDEHFCTLQTYVDDGIATARQQLTTRAESIEMSRNNTSRRLDAERNALEKTSKSLSHLLMQIEKWSGDASAFSRFA